MNRLREIRRRADLTQKEVASYIGITQNTYSYWENDKVNIDNESLQKLANLFGVSIDYLLGRETPVYHADSSLKFNLDEVELQDYYPVPLLGRVVAGVPIEAQENLEGYIYISFRPSEEYFALRVHGDSMKNVGINDKAIIVCHKQETAESGEIVIAMLNGEQTVKRYKLHGGAVFLMPENSDYLPIPVTPADDFLILGKVVEIRITV